MFAIAGSRGFAQPILPQAAPDSDALENDARSRFGILTKAERILLRSAPFRDVPWVGPDSDPDDLANDPAHGDKWGPDRTIRANLLRWLCTDPTACRLIHPSGLGIAGARIDGKLDFSYLTIDKPLTMIRCYVPAGIDLGNASVHGIDFRNGNFGPISADMMTSAGDVFLRFGRFATASFFRANIAGSLDFTGATFSNPGDDAISAIEAKISGDAIFHDGFTTDGIVDFRLGQIGQSLSFHDARFIGADDNGLNAERATVNGTFYWVKVRHTGKTQL
ncbi:MAG TPA: hypothetical protein VIX12_08020, partial [Candidatus Binataceae bacterium]